jgi:hypothetical protein
MTGAVNAPADTACSGLRQNWWRQGLQIRRQNPLQKWQIE